MKNPLFIIIPFLIFITSCEKNGPTLDGSNISTGTSLSVSKSSINIGKDANSVYFSVTSNTDWTVYVNNSGSSINGLDVSPMSGGNNGTIKVKYGAVNSTYYGAQQAVVSIFYYSYGVKQSKSVNILRPGHNP